MYSEITPADTNAATDVATATDAATETTPTILKTATCPSLSGKSTLSYNIGHDTAGQTQIQVFANTGGGYLNDDFIALLEIQAELQKQPKSITSGSLRCLYPSKSNNSPGFLLAVLKHVGLVQVSQSNPRCYELCSDAPFLAEVATLMRSAPVLDAPIERKTLTLKGKPKRTT